LENIHASADLRDPTVIAAVSRAREALDANRAVLDVHAGYLIHSDFAPQNFRYRGGHVIFLDVSSLRFGHRYECWARFINSMLLLNEPVARHLSAFVLAERGPNDALALRLMRAYKAAFLIAYYARALQMATGDLYQLCIERISFWTRVVDAMLSEEEVDATFLAKYRATRDRLRSRDEKIRRASIQ
jgi:hypothetical protein